MQHIYAWYITTVFYFPGMDFSSLLANLKQKHMMGEKL